MRSFAHALLLSLLVITGTNASLEKSNPAFALQQKDCQFSGTFTQLKFVDGIDQALESSGVFYHHCNAGVIWSTLAPLSETLIMRRDGKGFVVKPNSEKKLTSHQGKFLSSLLNSLMSGDQSAIKKQFDISVLDTAPKVNHKSITLTPKKRAIKRAIKSIEVESLADNSQVNITILDRHSQKTLITSIKETVFDTAIDAKEQAENCALAYATASNTAPRSCDILFQSSTQ